MNDVMTNVSQSEPGSAWISNRDTVYPIRSGEEDVVFLTPDEMELYPRSSFRNDTEIRSVYLPEGLTELPESYFYGCTSLTRVHLPYTLKQIGNYAFYGCTALKEIVLPDVLRDIGQFAFAGCTALLTLRIPQTVARIGAAAFHGCTALHQLEFENEPRLEAFSTHCFQNCTALREFSLPSSVKVIPTSLFYGCGGLKFFEVPSSVTMVRENAFYKSCLTEVVFRSGGTLLQPHALEGLEAASCFLWTGADCLPITRRDNTETVSVRELAEDKALPDSSGIER